MKTLMTVLLFVSAVMAMADDSREVSQELLRIHGNASLSNAEKLELITAVRDRPGLSPEARGEAVVRRLNHLIHQMNDRGNATIEAAEFLETGPTRAGQTYTAADIVMSSLPIEERMDYASNINLPSQFSSKLKMNALVAMSDEKAKTSPSEAFEFLSNSPIWVEAVKYDVPLSVVTEKLAAYAAAALRSDALEWAKANYAVSDLKSVNRAIDIVTRAFRVSDNNIIRANQFIDFQKSGAGVNPLSGVESPDLIEEKIGSIERPPGLEFLYMLYSGNFANALDLARVEYATASNANISKAVDKIAQVLKAKDQNVIRANAYIQSQKDQIPFDLSL
jgi:hypothetical protein